MKTNNTKSKSPNRSPHKKHESLSKKDSSPNHSRKSSPNKPKRSDSLSPRSSKKSGGGGGGDSPRNQRKIDEIKKDTDTKSPKKIKSSLKQPSRSLSIENPTCVECYLSGKQDKG